MSPDSNMRFPPPVVALLLAIACARHAVHTPSPATYFGRFEPADLPMADCFATAFHDLGIPPLTSATDGDGNQELVVGDDPVPHFEIHALTAP